MTDRERLIELIREAKKQTKNAKSDLERNMIFADYILSDGWIRPPCKVGDTVYFLDLKLLVIRKVEVTNVTITSSSPRKCVLIGLTDGYWHGASDFGISLFYTREEAEKALAEREVKE